MTDMTNGSKRHEETPGANAHGWPQPKRGGNPPANDPKRGFANAVRFGNARRAMPFKATGHKGGITFR